MTTNARGRIELDPSVCYRHPGRQSWTLCERCGRTICPECQLLTPRGVQCPECVRESGGSVQWQPAGPQGPRRRASSPVARLRAPKRGRQRSVRRGPSAVLAKLPEGATVTWTVLGVVLLLWLAGFALGNLPFLLLAAIPGEQLQLWRFVTAPLVYPSGFDFISILSLLLAGLFFGLSGPQLERQLGRNRYVAVLAVSAVVSSAAALLAGAWGYGLVGPLFGLFGALLVLVWPDSRVRTQIIVMIGLNLLLALTLGGLPALVGGLLAGAGAMYVLRAADDHGGRRPWLILGASTGVLVVLAVARGISG